MRYLIFGANGLIGRTVIKQLQNEHECFGTYYKREEPGLIKIDITSEEDLKKIFNTTKPDCIIHCANLAGGVNFCEKNPEIAKKFHLEATKSIGNLCEEYASRFVFISTDYIFDGEDQPYKEDDEPNPLNVYGRLKLDAENWIKYNVSKYLIVRTTNVFGWDPATVTPNYMMSFYRSTNENKEFNAPSFLWGNPTYVGDLASAIIELCNKNMDGVFHVVGSSFVNRYDWTLKACNKANCEKNLIKEIKEPPENMVPRPLKSNLNTEKFRSICKTTLGDVDQGLEMFVKNIKEGF